MHLIRKKPSKAVLCVILGLSLVLGLFAACGGGAAPSQAETTAAASTAAVASTTEAQEKDQEEDSNSAGDGSAADNKDAGATTKAPATTKAESGSGADTPSSGAAGGPSWANDTSPVELSMYVAEGWWQKDWDLNKSVPKYVTDQTGVSLDIWTSSGDAWDKLNAMIASDTLPDLMVMGIWASQIKQITSLGYAYPLDDLISRYAPEFDDIIAPQMKKWYTEDDGKWYALAGFGTWEEDVTPETKIYTNSGMQVRADICEALGIDMTMFETKQGTLDACRMVKDAQYEYNGLKVAPLNIGMQGTSGLGKILDFFDTPQEDKDGKLTDRRFQPGYLETLLWLNEAYREGLYSEENFTFDRMAIAERMTSGSIFLLIDQISDFKSEAVKLNIADPNAYFKPCGPFLSDSGATPNMTPRALAGWTVTLVNSKTKHPDRAINFMYWSYSEVGQMLWGYGIEGMHWEWDPDYPGHVRQTATWIQEKLDDENAATNHGTSDFWWFYNIPFLQSRDPKPITQGDLWSAEIDNYFAKWAYNDLAFNSIVLEGGSDEAGMNAEINTYWDNQLPLMITASDAATCEKIWIESLDEIQGMGANQVLEARDVIFQKHKQMLGQKFAYPSNN